MSKSVVKISALNMKESIILLWKACSASGADKVPNFNVTLLYYIFLMIGREIEAEEKLYIHKETLKCAISESGSGCIPCLYKLAPNGKFDDISFPSNVRPELCGRLDSNKSENSDFDAGIYWSKVKGQTQRVLTCGDGDFTFSLSLTNNKIYRKRKRKGDTELELVATSHETKESVLSTYGDPAAHTLQQLKENGATVLNGIDATKLHKVPELLNGKKFDRIVWNFPCIGQGLSAGADGQSSEMELNKTLVKDFFRSAAQILAPNGEVHVAHKTIEPFCWWKLPSLGKESESGLECVCSMVFDRALFPGYVNRKALHKKSFPSHDAQIYVFKARAKAASTATSPPAWAEGKCTLLDKEGVGALYGQVQDTLRRLEVHLEQQGRKREEKRKRKREEEKRR